MTYLERKKLFGYFDIEIVKQFQNGISIVKVKLKEKSRITINGNPDYEFTTKRYIAVDKEYDELDYLRYSDEEDDKEKIDMFIDSFENYYEED